jgi:hypothetical protein
MDFPLQILLYLNPFAALFTASASVAHYLWVATGIMVACYIEAFAFRNQVSLWALFYSRDIAYISFCEFGG